MSYLKPLCFLVAMFSVTSAGCSDSPAALDQGPISSPPMSTEMSPVEENHGATEAPTARACDPADSCEDGDPCTENRCLDGRCDSKSIPTDVCCDATALWFSDFTNLPQDLSISEQNKGVGWQLSTAHATSAPTSLYFGDPREQSYDIGERVQGHVTLPPITLPQGYEPLLQFRVMAHLEPNATFDRFIIDALVLNDEGAVTETIELSSKSSLPPGSDRDFALFELPLTGLAEQTISIRLSFDSVDGNNNAFEGVYIDDLALLSGCPSDNLVPCDPSLDPSCEEANETGTSENEDDNPSEPCEGVSEHEACCEEDSDCDDGDLSTINSCEGTTCVSTPNPDHCLSDAACDDGQECTEDSCVAGLCHHVGTIGPGCCEPSEQSLADFDQGKLKGIYVTDNLETGVFWTPDATRSADGDYALYCGDPTTQSYAIGRRVKSSATTPLMSIPEGGLTSVNFALHKNTRTSKNLDVFQVLVLRDGALMSLWSSRSLGDSYTTGDGFRRISLPLSHYAGQSLQLRFVFDSVDDLSPSYEGVYLDTIGLKTVCE